MGFGAKNLFKGVSLQFNPGNRYGLIGANGSGKSTLIHILAGELTPDSGDVKIPQQMTIGSLKQDHYLFENEDVLDVVLRGRKDLWKALQEKKQLLKSDLFNEQQCDALVKIEKIIEEQNGYAAESEAAKLLEGLGIREPSHRQSLSLLSGGFKLRVLLAQIFFGNHPILVLDEPTNHLDLYSIKWLEGYLRNFPGTLILTSHDRDFINGVCNHIADVDYGTIKIYKGNYDSFVEQKNQEREQKSALLAKHDKRREDLQEFIDRFGAKATKAGQAQSKAKVVEKIEEEMENLALLPSSRLFPRLNFPLARASGITVLKVKGLDKSYGSKQVLKNVAFEVERGSRMAIIGPNGIGKSTLLEILTGHTKPDQGEFNWGFASQAVYFPQDHAREVKGESSLLEWLGQFDRSKTQEQLRSLLGLVLFSGDTVNQSIQTLSGGEKARLILAKMMMQMGNVLIFDEPTNHLDLEAIDELTRALQNYEGTLLLVSHNRYFVSRLADRILEINYDGVTDFNGTYTEFVEKKERDHLAAPSTMKQRYGLVGGKESANISSQYEEQKRIRSIKNQLKKKIAQIEEDCHKLEGTIKDFEHKMSSVGFYQKTPQEEQTKLIKQKFQLEEKLLAELENWELAGIELQRYEEE